MVHVLYICFEIQNTMLESYKPKPKKTGLVIDVGKKTTTNQHLIEFAIEYLTFFTTFFTVLISKYLIKVKLKCLTTERGVHIGCD